MGKIYQALEKSNSATLDIDSSTNTDDLIVDTGKEQEYAHLKNQPGEKPMISEPYEKHSDSLDPSLVTVHEPNSIASEQFRLLKNNILFPEKGTPPRSIMITSPLPNEGKSFVSANLAITIARSIDEYVLLMDCDLRSPTLHRLFGLLDKKGLSDHLSNGNPLSSLLVKTYINKLTVLTGGTIPRNPSELLSSGRMRNLIHEVTSRYSDRYIIFDTPPPYITSEGNFLSRQVDGIILVIQNGRTRKKDVQDVLDIYGKEKIIGVVQNFAKRRIGHDYGYYKYGYGYGK